MALGQIYYGTSLQAVDGEWLNTGDHCAWSGITCSAEKKVTTVVIEDFGIEGTFPQSLSKLSELTTLTTDGNSLAGTISDGICNKNNIQIVGDETNCPNNVGTDGCCAAVRLTDPSPYLINLVSSEMNIDASDCSLLPDLERNVCNFMKDDENHYVFGDEQYPDSFPYESWLKVRCCNRLYHIT